MTTRTLNRAAAGGALIASLLLTACTGTGGASMTPTASASLAVSMPPSADASPTSSEAASPAASTPASPQPSAEPTADLGPFSCSFPVEGSATTDRAQLTDVRVGEHDGYDRIVFQFDGGLPAYAISEATPPFTMDPSGLPLEVQGSYFWQIILTGGTKMNPDGSSSYAGSTDFTPGFDKLVELVEGGDFEAVSTWYAGMSASSCIRVLTLDGPARLVIDIEH